MDHLRVEHDFGDGYVRLHISEAERRQAAQDIHCNENVLLELLRNSKDAHATHIFVALTKEGDQRTITVIDDGDGIPSSMHDHIFEPRVTSKLDTSHKDAWGFHGRGMALYSIKVNALEAQVVSSSEERGSAIRVRTDTNKLPERTDQSTFPSFELEANNKVNVRGPRNLLRCACEFALNAHATTAITIGSPSEIAATLYAYGVSMLSAIDRAFCQDLESLPVTKRLAVASDPKDFQRIAESLGLEMSDRTARRILDGQIQAVQTIIDQIDITSSQESSSKKNPQRRSSRIKLQQDEIETLVKAAHDAFDPVARSYYLDPSVAPHIRISPTTLTINIPLIPSTESMQENE